MTPTTKQIAFVNKITQALDIEFPWTSKQYTKKAYSNFISANINNYKDHIRDTNLDVEDAYELCMNDAWTEHY